MTGLRAWTWVRELELAEPYTIAYDSYDHTTNVFVRLETPGGVEGVGCAAPAAEVTGETPEACARALRDATGLLEGSRAPLDARTRAALRETLAGAPAAAAAVDMALHDLHARQLGVPLHALWGRCRADVVTSITLGIEPPDATVERGRERAGQGFEALKVKGGRDVEEDIERLRRLREALPDVALRFDANQGYDAADTERLARACRACRLELIEQPTPASDRDSLSRATRAIAPVPMVADESCVSLGDATELCAAGAVSGLNVKLMKIGSLGAAAAAARVAASFGHGCMVSCMDESAIAIAAALHWALCEPAVRWVDLDGHLDLVDDPGAGAVLLRRGRLHPVDAPGLGVRLNAPT